MAIIMSPAEEPERIGGPAIDSGSAGVSGGAVSQGEGHAASGGDPIVAASEGEARSRAMADAAPAPIWLTSANGIEFANRALIEFVGLPLETLLGTGWTGIVHPDDLGELLERRAAAWAGAAIYSFEARLRRFDGEWRWHHASLKPRFDGGETPAGFVGMAFDVTDAKRAEAELRESEQRFRAMADCAPAPVWVTDENGIAFVNKAFTEIAGRTAEDLTGDYWMSMIHPDDLAEVLEKRAEAWRTGGGYGYDARFRHADGALRWMQVSCRPRLDVAGKLIGYVGVAVDVTEAKVAAAALREGEERLRIALAAGALGDWSWDSATDMVTFSEQAGRLFGVPGGPVATWTNMQRLILPEDAPRAGDEVAAAVRDRRDYSLEYRVRHPQSGLVWINAVGRPVYHPDGRIRGVIGVVQDITARKQAEEAL